MQTEPTYKRAARELEEHGEVQPETLLISAIFDDFSLRRDGTAVMEFTGSPVVYLGKATPNGWRS